MNNRIAVTLLILLLFSAFTPSSSQAQDLSDGNRKIVAKVMPLYPDVLRSMNIQGTVRANVVVTSDGKVKSVAVKGGHPLLVQSAENALRQWKWAPAGHESSETVEMIFKP